MVEVRILFIDGFFIPTVYLSQELLPTFWICSIFYWYFIFFKSTFLCVIRYYLYFENKHTSVCLLYTHTQIIRHIVKYIKTKTYFLLKKEGSIILFNKIHKNTRQCSTLLL